MASTLNASTSGAGGVITTADSSGVLQLQTAGTNAVTVDASQNVGIGTTSPTYKVDISTPAASALATGLRLSSSNTNGYGSALRFDVNNGVVGQYTAGLVNVENSTGTSTDGGRLKFYTAAEDVSHTLTERMRIGSDGKVMFNTSSVLNAGYMSLLFDGSAINGFTIKNSSATFGPYLYFVNSAGNVAGYVIQNGTTTVSYTTSSDYRLKENIVPMTGALDKVLQLKPVNYTWKQDGLDGQGFIAHELQAVVPDAVVGEKDAVDAEGNPKYQGVDTSFLVATLTAAIQEQQTIINDLKARVTALEAK